MIASLLWLMFVMFDFASSGTLSADADPIRVPLPVLEADRVYFVKFDNRQLVVMRYSSLLQQSLFPGGDAPDYLVAYALGTYLGCPLDVVNNQYLKESCSSASYDFAGQPQDNNQNFTALAIPVYTFCPDNSCITLYP